MGRIGNGVERPLSRGRGGEEIPVGKAAGRVKWRKKSVVVGGGGAAVISTIGVARGCERHLAVQCPATLGTPVCDSRSRLPDYRD